MRISLLKLILELRERPHAERFYAAANDPESSQRQVLADMIARHEGSVFGREHRFSAIRSPRDFQKQVPIRDYEGYRPYIRRLDLGERAVLTTDPLEMFTTTSGTSGEPKLIPVTHAWREHMASLMRLWYYRAMQDHPTMFRQKVLSIVSPAYEGTTPGGKPYGAMSGLVFKRTPWVVRRHYAIPYEVCLVKDHALRYYLTMRLALAELVSVLGTPNPTSLVRLADVAASQSEALIRGIRDGTIGLKERNLLPADVSVAVSPFLKANRRRARFLEAQANRYASILPRHAWPDLKLVTCWLGGTAGLHAKRLIELYGDVPIRDLGLIASEGRMTIPTEDRTPAGALAVHANFYEFIPEEAEGHRDPPILLAHQLELGKRYFILLTTGNGLYRYDINDVVEVQGFYQQTPSVSFVRKGQEMVSLTGEKLHPNHIQMAIAGAEHATGREVWQYRLIPQAQECRYDLLVEFATPPEGKQPPNESGNSEFLKAYEEVLAKVNSEFAGKRSSRRLGPSRLFSMRSGWSERLCKEEFAAGKREHQYKWKVIIPEWDAQSRKEIVSQLDAVLL